MKALLLFKEGFFLIYVFMNRLEIIRKYANQIWCMNPSLASALLPSFVSILKGEEQRSFSDLKQLREDLEAKTSPQIAILRSDIKTASGTQAFEIQSANQLTNSNIPKGSIAVMRVNGVIMKEGDACTKGISDYMQELNQAGLNENIEGVVIEVHSGGGSAFGTEEFANAIGSFEKTYKKPLAAFISNEAASAAYLIIAKAPKIFISGEMTVAGSIGTMITLHNVSEYLSKEGVEEIIVRATDSFNKNEEFYQALEGNQKPLQNSLLDPLNKTFQKIVKQGRKGSLDLETVENGVPEVLTGKLYVGRQILKAGLADEIASKDSVLRYINKRAKEMQNNSSKNKIKNKMLNLSKASDLELQQELDLIKAKMNEETSEEVVQSMNQEASLIEKEIEFRAMKGKIAESDKAQEENASMQAKIEELTQKNADLETASAEQAAQIEDLQKKLEDNSEKEELNQKIEELNQKNQDLEDQNGKLQNFVDSKFGEGTVEKLSASAPDDSQQPEGKKEPKAPKTARERRILNSLKAQKLSNKLRNKK